MSKVKICGITNKEDAFLARQLGADYIGLVFAESQRKVTKEQAQTIIGGVPGFGNFVGVFVNESPEMLEAKLEGLKLKFLQFHGDESPEFCRYFMDKGYEVIKAIRIKDEASLQLVEKYPVKYILLDTYSEEAQGGTGQSFNWDILKGRSFKPKRLFISGGLNPDNVSDVVQKFKPYAVDVSSGVEAKPGIKNFRLIKQFIENVKGKKDSILEI